jgi:hypothetical protein
MKQADMAPLPSASLIELNNAPEPELVREIDMHLAALNSSLADFRKAHHALQAQLLIQEITRRDFVSAQKAQFRQTITMVVCTVVITVLTAIITWVTVFPSR